MMGVESSDHTVTISGSRITDNFAQGFGGGLIALTGLTATDSIIAGNTAGNGAGGIYCSSVTLTNSTPHE